MWTITAHFRAFLLSVALLAAFLKLKTENAGNSEHLVNNDTLLFENSTEQSSVEIALNSKRKKYRNFIFDNVTANVRSGNDSSVYILGLFELSTKFGMRQEGVSEVAAAQLAVRHVNERDFLKGHELKLLINDTECDPGAGIDRFFHALYSEKVIVMLLGSGCSNVTESLANIVPYWNILQMSFGSESPTLSDRNKFPLFFRTATPDSSHSAAKSAFVRHFRWQTVATFSQRENTYLLPSNDLVRKLETVNVSCEATLTFSQANFKEQLLGLKEMDVRIIIGSFSDSIAESIFCEVYKLNMYGADYVWILQERQPLWWMRKATKCSFAALRAAVEGIIYISHHNQIPSKNTSFSGLTNDRFVRSFNFSVTSAYARQTYDAVWAMALVLGRVQEAHGFNLSEFYYDKYDFLDRTVEEMQRLDFMGVSGPVKFHGADRIGNSVIKQIQGGELKNIAIYYSAHAGYLEFNCSGCSRIKWRGNRVPIAKRTLKTRLLTIPEPAFYIICAISFMGILTCLVCLYFNFHFRRRKVVKLSSPRLNNIAVIGCILVYTAVVLLGVDGRTILRVEYFPKLCTMRVYLLAAGFSLAFGSMFAKTYRVHRIFTYRCASLVKDKILKDKQLITLILLLLLVDALIVTVWTYNDPLQRRLHNLTVEISSGDRAVLYQSQVEVCACTNTTGWFIALYGYKGFLLIMGVYMAWETRRIKVEALNDSQYISVCVYSAVFSSIIVLLSSFLSEYVLVAYLARTVSILLSATLTLVLLFAPKMKAVLWDGEQDPIVQSMGLKTESNTRRFMAEDPRELTYRMEVQNKVYRCEIEALDLEIARLERLLSRSNTASVSFVTDEPYASSKASRASWPSAQHHDARQITARNNFLSDSTLHSTNFGERLRIFDHLKKFFERIPSAWLWHLSGDSTATGGGASGKSQSMNVVCEGDEFEPPFFISIDENQFQT